ncbi:MAG: hypothetical protein II969_08625 [Anaerolineaceae bacterium]|nr:hypothetical protein [Anaerolineaceae bacterium]
MNQRKLLLILDIDGVLLEAEGYRAACVDTINHFIQLMGQENLSITREIADVFEVSRIACEWDMVPLSLAAFVNWYCEKTGEFFTDNSFPPKCEKPLNCDNVEFRAMLLDKIREYASFLNDSETTINSVYHGYQRKSGEGMDALWEQPFRDRFFVDTLNPWKSPFFAELMTRLLGKSTFENFYGIPAPLDCESYLETKDHLLISEYYRKLLPNLSDRSIYPAVMTYRPSLLPEKGNKKSSYFVNTPEAECALHLLGWSEGKVPMIGGGSICYIEEKYNLRREHYVKPHPFHALASALIAICKDDIQSLELARQLCEFDPETQENPIKDLLSQEDHIELAVFEDSISGIESVRNAAKILKKWKYNAEVVCCGIKTTDAKNEKLKNNGVMVYNNVNTAFDSIIGKF